MDCKEMIDRLYEFLDTEMSPAELTAVRAHLDGCDDCGEQAGLERRFLDALRDCTTSDRAPRELRDRVIAKIRGVSPPAV
jgi:anti-sigma factor (TIGR02949 family)